MDLELRKKRAAELKGRETRRAPIGDLELREVDGGLRLTGWASVTERDYDMGWYTERIQRGAFAATLAERPDVQLLINHEGLPLARTVSGTLRLAEDDRGLGVDADLNTDDPDVQRLAPKVERGDIDEMSFAFMGAKSDWDEDFTYRTITTLSIHRGDVSVVNYGANPLTSFSMRDALQAIASTELVESRDQLSDSDLRAAFDALDRLLNPAPAVVEAQPEIRRVPLDLARAINVAGRK